MFGLCNFYVWSFLLNLAILKDSRSSCGSAAAGNHFDRFGLFPYFFVECFSCLRVTFLGCFFMTFSLCYRAISWHVVLGPCLCAKNSSMGLNKVPKKYHYCRISPSINIPKNVNLLCCKNGQNCIYLGNFAYISAIFNNLCAQWLKRVTEVIRSWRIMC